MYKIKAIMADLRFPLTNFQEPKRLNRFTIVFPDYCNIESYVVQRIKMPKLKPIKKGKVVYYAWTNMEIRLIEIIGRSASAVLIEAFANKPVSQLFTFEIHHLDPCGVIIDTWTVTSDILSIDFGNLDYADDNLITTKLKLAVSSVTQGIKN